MRNNDIGGATVVNWRVSEQDHLQEMIDDISAQIRVPDETGRLHVDNRIRFRGGAVIRLQKGTYDCDLVIHNPGVTIIGEGSNQTEITGKVTVYAPFTQMYDLAIRGAGKPYGLRVMRNPAALDPFGKPYTNVSRCRFENLIVGGSYWQGWVKGQQVAAGIPIDGPVNGVEIDGVYLTSFRHVTVGFCSNDGWHIEATNGLYPSTTLGFEDCSGVKNGRFGWYVLGPCNGFHVLRGNTEQNGIIAAKAATPPDQDGREMWIESVTNIHLQNHDFEGEESLASCIFMSTSNAGLIEGCSYFYAAHPEGPRPFRFFEAASSAAITLRGNRTQGFGPGRIGQFDERCFGCSSLDHQWGDSGNNQHIKVFGTGHPLMNSYR